MKIFANLFGFVNFLFLSLQYQIFKVMAHMNLVRKRLKELRFGQYFFFDSQRSEMGVRLHYNRHQRCYNVISTASDDLLFYHGDLFVYIFY